MKKTPFLDTGHIQICNDATIAFCKELAHLVDALPQKSWTQVIRAGGVTSDYSLFPRDERIAERHKIAHEEADTGLFSYSFARIADSEENGLLLPWKQMKELLISPSILQLITDLTDHSISNIDLVYANCFRDGDFLTTHTDRGTHSKVAAAFSLTETWNPAEGGCTYVLEQDRKSVVDIASPHLGTLLLMDLERREVPHYVSEVKNTTLGENFLRKSVIVRYS